MRKAKGARRRERPRPSRHLLPSNAVATRSSRSSSPWAAMNCSAIGRPSSPKPQGTVTAGQPVRLARRKQRLSAPPAGLSAPSKVCHGSDVGRSNRSEWYCPGRHAVDWVLVGVDGGGVSSANGEVNRDAVFAHIDAILDDHLAHAQRWVRQPSGSSRDDGVRDLATMLVGHVPSKPHSC